MRHKSLDGSGSAADSAVLRLPTEAVWDRDIEGTRVVFGAGRLDELGPMVRELGGRRVLLVADEGITAAGHSRGAIESLRRAGLDQCLFDAVESNPTDANVDAGVAVASQHRADFLVALGGGSPMDCAKGINFVYTNGGAMADYEGFGRSTRPLLPSVGVPTTAGTGSEAQSYALITAVETHRKMACGASDARFRTVILDPALTDSLPRSIAAAASLDAVSHAIESYVTTTRCPQSSHLAAEAWRLLLRRLPGVLDSPGDHAAWGEMQIAALLAGAAIERSMLGAAHACANPLTERYGTVHGIAVALVLPHVVRFNAATVEDLYAELLGGTEEDEPPADSAGEILARRVEELRHQAGMPVTLGQAGVAAADIELLAERASRQWTLAFNPRQASVGDLMEIYRHAL